jgi:hypothetical protein
MITVLRSRSRILLLDVRPGLMLKNVTKCNSFLLFPFKLILICIICEKSYITYTKNICSKKHISYAVQLRKIQTEVKKRINLTMLDTVIFEGLFL